jgi:hypothetical protein
MLTLTQSSLYLSLWLQLTPSGLGVEHVSKPEVCERVAKNGDVLTMHYTGTLEDGKKFDSSYDRSEPFKFQIGVGQVIKGWEEGVLGMCVGKKRRLLLLFPVKSLEYSLYRRTKIFPLLPGFIGDYQIREQIFYENLIALPQQS